MATGHRHGHLVAVAQRAVSRRVCRLGLPLSCRAAPLTRGPTDPQRASISALRTPSPTTTCQFSIGQYGENFSVTPAIRTFGAWSQDSAPPRAQPPPRLVCSTDHAPAGLTGTRRTIHVHRLGVMSEKVKVVSARSAVHLYGWKPSLRGGECAVDSVGLLRRRGGVAIVRSRRAWR